MCFVRKSPNLGEVAYLKKRINIGSVGTHFCSDGNHNLGEVTYL